MKLRERIASLFVFILLLLQVYDFVLDSLDAANVQVSLPPFLNDLAIFATMFLAFFIFQEFLEIEFGLRPVTVYTLISIFFLSNVNIMLKFILPNRVLVEYRGVLNMLPILLMFLVLPVVAYLFEKSVRKMVMLLLLAIGIVYPVSQLYSLLMDKFVALAATLYLVYSVVKSTSREGLNLRELFQMVLEFDTFIAEELLIKPAGKVNKLAFYFYAVLLFYILSDFNLYVVPATTGLWDPSGYLAQLGLTVSRVHVPAATYISLGAYVYFILYPFLLRALHEKLDVVKLTVVEIPVMVTFFIFPSVLLSPLVSYNGYGVVMMPWVPNYDVRLSIFALVASLSLFAIIPLYEKNWPEVLSSVLPLASLSFIAPYVLVYIYSLTESIIMWYRTSPYLVFLVVLLAFFVISIAVISWDWMRQALVSAPGMLTQVVLLYVALVFLVLVPSIYSTSFFILMALYFVAVRSGTSGIFLKGALVFYLSTILFLGRYELLSVLLLVLLYFILNFRDELVHSLPDRATVVFSLLLVPAFILFGRGLGEIIPFSKTAVGLLLLLLFSVAEEVMMKGIIYRGAGTSLQTRLVVGMLFLFTHLLNLNIFFTYLKIIPIYSVYLFLYQLLSLYLYDRHPSVPYLSLVHFLINAGILLA